MAIGPDGPIGYATDVAIDEVNASGTNRPSAIHVRARGSSLDVQMDLAVAQTTVTGQRQSRFSDRMDFLQMRAQYHVTGRVAGRAIDIDALGSAETFRGR